jgi:hypothetical protein
MMFWLEEWGKNNCSEEALKKFAADFGSEDKNMDDEMQWINDNCEGDI